MGLTGRQFYTVVLAMGVAVLGAVLLSQYWGGLIPCELCLLQRWPWWIALAIAAIAWLAADRLPAPMVALILAVVFFVSAGLAFYHAGVELHWFAGPTACTSSGANPATLDDLRKQLLAAPVTLCDQVQWSLFGISLAGWNFLGSLVMAVFCARYAARRSPRRRTA
jgi:disulfide bond formation protein DsbB